MIKIRIGANVWALCPDPKRNKIWFAFAPSLSENKLAALDLATDKVSTWSIPVTQYDGMFTQVKVGDDGAVWVAENYTLMRLDPGLQTVASVTFPLQAAGAAANALTGPGTGTGISSILPDGSGVVVARSNVTNLTRIDSNLVPAGYIPLPPGVVGPSSIGRLADASLVMFTGGFSTGVLTVLNPDYTLRSQAPLNVNAINVDGSDLIVVGGASTGNRMSASLATKPVLGPALKSNLDAYSLAVADPRGGQTIYDAADGTVLRVLNGAVAGSYQMPLYPAFHMSKPLLGASDTPTDIVVPPSPPIVLAIADDASGMTWCAVANDQTLYGVRV